MASDEKRKAAELALKQLEKDFGKGAANFLTDKSKYQVSRDLAIPSGVISLDAALGIGGLPRGRISELYGAESSGKTTLALSFLAEAQMLGDIGAIIDCEHALDPDWAERCGVDLDNLIISQPDYGEQALEIVESLVMSNSVGFIVVDSVPAIVPRKELELGLCDETVGLQARLLSRFFRTVVGRVEKSRCHVLFINQIRDNIGGYGNTTPGGKALKFYSSVRMNIKKTSELKHSDSDFPVGVQSLVNIVKNKVAPPFRKASIDIDFTDYSAGVSKIGDLIDVAVSVGTLEKNGAWYKYQGQNIAQGREKAKIFLIENPDIRLELDKRTRDIYFAPKDKGEKREAGGDES